MNKIKIALWILTVILLTSFNAQLKMPIAIVIHGGAGTILKEKLTPAFEEAYKSKLNEALDAGYKILQQSGSSIDAVEAAIRVMEDSPLFNAGKGSVFNSEGKNEMDASIMEGKSRRAGAVAGVTTIKNPVTAAKAVMQQSPHVLMTGKGAEEFAAGKGIETVDAAYFFDQKRFDEWQKTKAREDSLKNKERGAINLIPGKFGTVGAVALDDKGTLAAATSTGGMTNKKFGRVGDSPIIGAGTYADNKTCAVSCTGHGEYFIRLCIARDVAAMMEYKNYPVKKAADEAIYKKLTAAGGTGGLIALDAKGNMAMPFNTSGMYRGYIDVTGKKEVKIFKE